MKLIFEVHQGSVLGPLLFMMYTMPLSSLLHKAKDIKHQLYTDNTQVQNSFNTSSFDNFIHNLQTSLVSVQDLMYKNKLKLNPDKTEFLLIINKPHRKDFLPSFYIDSNNISPTPSTHNMASYLTKIPALSAKLTPWLNPATTTCVNLCGFANI